MGEKEIRVLRAVCVIFGILTTLAVAGRVYIRRSRNRQIATDDYLAVAAGITFWAVNGILIYDSFDSPVLNDFENATTDDIAIFLKVCFSKLSVLTLFFSQVD